MTQEIFGFEGTPMAPSTLDVPSPAAPAPAAQGPTGVPPNQPQAPAPGATMAPPSAPPAQPAPPQPSGQYALNGRVFESQAALDTYARQLVRTAEGRARAAAAEEARRVAPPTPQAVPAQPAPQAPEPGEEKAYDTSIYALVLKTYGAEAAEDYRARAIAEHNRKVVEETVEKRFAPLQQSEEERQLQGQAQELFARAVEAVGQDGRPLLPEFKNQAEAEAIVNIWKDLEPSFAMTPKGVWHAAMVFRGIKAGQGFVALPSPPAAQPSGVSIDASSTTPGMSSGQPQVSGIPRPSTTNAITGERYAIQ